MDAEPQGSVLVGVVMGSRNDYAVMRATVEVLKGKQQLAIGDFKSAVESFAAANKYCRSLKVSLVLLCLRIAPRLLQQAYRLRNN